LRKTAWYLTVALLLSLLVGGGAGCGQTDLSKVNIDNPVLNEAWNRYAAAEAAGVDEVLLQRVRQDLVLDEERLKKNYLESGDTRDAGIEAVIAGLTAELQNYVDNKLAADAEPGALPLVEQEKVFERIRTVLTPSLSPDEYIYAIAVSKDDPTWALAWFDGDPRDLAVDGPALALRLSQEAWDIKYVGHDISAFPGLPSDLATDRVVYTWLSDSAWVVTQTESYLEANRPGEAYDLARFDFDAAMNYAYVYVSYPGDTLGFRYQKTVRSGWALIEVDRYPSEAPAEAAERTS
jgi:hypothetical protein